jgi:hypothetical protein
MPADPQKERPPEQVTIPGQCATPEELSDVDVSQIDDLLRLTPTERLIRHEQTGELVEKLQEAGRRLYGFDPQAPGETD